MQITYGITNHKICIKDKPTQPENSPNFGKSTNVDEAMQPKAIVRANNLASITNISYKKIQQAPVAFRGYHQETAEKIAQIILTHKTPHSQHRCPKHVCPECTSAVKSRILSFVQGNEPIQMTLSGFPFKAMSRRRCLTEYPDMAEAISLRHLNLITQSIQDVFKPGANLTIYNDGLMFTPIVVNPPDREALKYVRNLREMAQDLGVDSNVKIKTIGDFYGNNNICQGRAEILDQYPLGITEIKQKAVDPNDREIDLEYYTGSKKFAEEKLAAFEDGELEEILKERYESRPDDPKGIQYNAYIAKANLAGKLGRKSTEKLAGEIACDTMRRSKAWGTFIDSQQPDALRLSCHPQSCGSSKIGIYLTPDHNNWGAPWQLTAVEVAPGNFVLAKQSLARDLGFQRVYSHYTLPEGISHDNAECIIQKVSEKH